MRRRLDCDDGHVRVVQERLAARHGEVLDEVDLVALEGDDHRPLLVVELELHRVRVGLRAPVGVVAHELRADLGREAAELEGPGALERLPPVCGVEVGRDDDRVVVRRADEGGEVAVRGVEVEDDGGVVGRLDPTGREDAAERRLRVGGAAVGVDQLVEGRLDVVRDERRAAVERDALADLERPDRSVLVRLPALRDARLELELGVREGEELARGAEEARAALVLDEKRVRLGGGLDERDADVAAGLNAAGGRRRRAATCRLSAAAASARCREKRDQRDGHADDGAAAHELPPRDLARRVLVDDVVFELAAVLTDGVYATLRVIHYGLSPSARVRPSVSPGTPAYSSSRGL